jgi:acyl carrier protein
MNQLPVEIKQIFSRVLLAPLESISAESSPKTIGTWDSLRHVELVIEVENYYGVNFSPTEVFALTSVQGFCDMLVRKNALTGGVTNEHA